MNEQSTSGTQTGMDKFFAALRGFGIQRRTDDKWIAGVCSGLAGRMGIDPVIVRAGFIVLALLGPGLTIYLLAWVLIPNNRDEIVAQRALRDGDGGSIVLSILAALALFGGSAFGGGTWWSGQSGLGFPWVVFLTGLLIWWLVKRSGDHTDADRRVRAQQLGTPPAAGTSAAAPGPSSATPFPMDPKTQVLPQSQGFAMSQGLPQSQERDLRRWEGTPGFPQGQGSPQGAVPPGAAVTPQTQVARKEPGRRSGGPLMVLLAIGLALATYGSLVWAGNLFSWAGDHQTIALAGSLGSIGLLAVVLGVAGWRAGFMTFLAVVLAIAAWSSTIVPAGIHVNGRFGDALWTPQSLSTPASIENYRIGIGSGVLDLGRLPAQGAGAAANPVTIPAYVGVGELKVLVPSGLNVKVVGHVSLGAIVLPGDADPNGQGGSDVSRNVILGSEPSQVVVDAGVGIGQITVVKE